MDSNAIRVALYDRLRPVQGIVDGSIRYTPYTSISTSSQVPFLTLDVVSINSVVQPGQKTVHSLRFEVSIFHFDPNPDGATPLLMTLFERVTEALEVRPGERVTAGNHTTLGNTVVAARVIESASFDVMTTSQGQWGGVVIPIEVVAVN